ncbi:MAG: sugar ABC transporter substrate-binding protein [Salinibacterium sp.]|nr:sugar ABC transporter substrate-binding protein [Salinibacterium sp.]
MVATLALAACSGGTTDGGSGGSKTLSIGMNAGLVPQFETYVDDFKKTHDGWDIKVSAVPDPQPDYIQQLVTQGLSSTTPDILFNYDSLNPTLANNNLLFDLKPWLDEGKSGLKGDSFLPNFLGQYNISGKITGIPVSADSGLLFYNKTLFDKYGVDVPTVDWTMDDMYAAAKKITDASAGAVYGISTPLGTGEAYFSFYPVLRAYGSNVYDKASNKFVFADDAGVKAWTELLKPYTEGFGTPYSTTGPNLFPAGQSAMIVAARPSVGEYRTTITDDWNVQQMPTAEGKSTTGGGSYSLSISEKSGNKDAAWEFMSWFYATDKGMKAAEPNGVIPATKDGLENGSWKNDNNPIPSNLLAATDYAVKNAILPDPIPDEVQPKVAPELKKALESVVLNGVSVKEAYTAAQDALNELLK